ncbi:MAG: alpha-L-fucosidase, partial [Prevotella sp.]|nr:alpha-L-fucosidase [Prevotella sp.]
DWIREDYPLGRTGHDTGRTLKPNYDSYFQFMKNQVRELLTNYPNVAALWFDGYWDHDQDTIPFNWRMEEFYRYIHQLKPSCLIGNNHHITPIEGEDFQMFERDLPGENKAGYSGQAISKLPLEMCQTMNGMWGYKVADQNYKSVDELVTLIIRAAAKGCNLLLNIGPQPNGELPALALDRLQGIGKWMDSYGKTIYGSQRGIDDATWGVTTKKGNTTYIHVLDKTCTQLDYAMDKRPKQVKDFLTGNVIKCKYDKKKKCVMIPLEGINGDPDRVITIIE